MGRVEEEVSPMGIFERMAKDGHEQVIFCYDHTSGLKAIIAIHDTALGPARGGTRYKRYGTEDEALDDVLRLSKGMSNKFAFTDLGRGGGKAVILADDNDDKELMLRAFGRFVQLLAGRFGTGPDLGTSPADMAVIAEQTDYVWAVDERADGTGDSTPLTAQGVLAGLQAALEEILGTSTLAGRRVVVQGLGGVGSHLAELLVAAGAKVTGCDVDPGRAKEVAGRLGLDLVDPEQAYEVECDVFSPNAVGGVLNEHTIPRLACRIVAGGANNQLATAEDGERLWRRGVVYVPDYVINSAAPYAVIGAGELGYSAQRLAASVQQVAAAVRLVLRRAHAHDRPPAEVADQIAEERIAASARLRAMSPGTGAMPRRNPR
jgi:leucine dehydrogenase